MHEPISATHKTQVSDWRSQRFQDVAAAVQIGRSFSMLGGTPRMGFLSKKLTGLRSKLEKTVGMIGKSSWHGTWWNPIVYHTTMSFFSIGRSLGIGKKENTQKESWRKNQVRDPCPILAGFGTYLSLQTASVSSPLLWYTNSPPAHSSLLLYGVTQI